MVPTSFVEMSEMPLLPSGKVDRRALPESATGGAAARGRHIEPRNEVERWLVSIWRELLDVEGFGVTDNFFDLGGDSVLAMRVLANP